VRAGTTPVHLPRGARPALHGRVFGLDLVRAGAVALVLVAHASEALEPAFRAPRAFETLAVVGVELFFVLSGFLIGGIIIDSIRPDARWLANFWVRRWLRTLPNYFLFLALNVALFRSAYARWPAFGPFLVFGQALAWPHPQFFNEAWSLAIEEVFYLLAPLAALAALPLAATSRRVLLALVLVVLAIGAARLAYVLHYDPGWDFGVRKVTLLRLDCIVYGVIPAYVCRRWTFGPAARRWVAALGAALAGWGTWLFASGAVAASPAMRAVFFSVIPAGFAALLPLAAELDGASLPGAMRNATHHLALWSYSLYLTNLPVERLMYALHLEPHTSGAGIVGFFAVMVVSVAWAAATYRWFERPIMDVRDRVTEQLGLAGSPRSSPVRRADTDAVTTVPGASSWADPATIALGLAIVTVVSYLPVLDAGFLNWDDPPYVTANPNIQTLSLATVRWAFTTFQEGIWHPLTWLSLAADHALYGGLDPRGFHVTNLMLHVTNTVLVFFVWHGLTGAVWRSAFVGALFGLHPMHVESVAWVTERKDVLSTLFWLLTIAAYARYAKRGTATAYALVLGTYVLGLLAKPMLVTLPAVLLLLDYWPLRRLSWRTVVEKLPLVGAALSVMVVSVVAVADVSRSAVPDPIPPAIRLANAVVSAVRYLRLTLWPVHLSPWYSHPWFEGPPLSVAGVAAATAVIVGVTVLVVAGARRVPYATVGWLWYLGTLLPVLGLLYNGRQGMADRYAYIPHIGLFVAMTWTLADAWPWRSARVRGAVALVAATLLLALGALTWQQTHVWRDDRSFWSYTARTNRYSFIAHQALGALLQGEGRTRDAITEYGRAARLRPELARVHVQFANLLARTGRSGAAAAQLRKAVAADPGAADAHVMLARVLVARRRPVGARRELERALDLQPDLADARRLLATLDGAPEGR